MSAMGVAMTEEYFLCDDITFLYELCSAGLHVAYKSMS